MTRLARAVPGIIAGVAVILVAHVALTGEMPGPWWRPTAVLIGIVAGLNARRVGGLPLVFVVCAPLAAARVATSNRGPEPLTIDGDLPWAVIGADVLTGVAFVALVMWCLRRRYGRVGPLDVADLATVSLGAVLLTWLVAARPMIDQFGVSPGLALLASSYLPASALILTFDLDLWFAGLTRNRTMQFIVVAAIANLAGAVSIQLWAVGTLPGDAIDVITAMFVVSFLFLAAALAHPGARETMTRVAAGSPGIDAPRARLVVVAAALIAPAAIIAAVAPTSSLDITVRVVGMVLGVSAVMTRLWIATAEASRTQTTLVQNMNRDELTGLPNRSRFVECVSETLEQTWRTEQRPMVIQLNIDRFKNINDSLGHSDANRVLVEVGRRLANSVGSFGGVVARVGGDDFVIVDTTTRSTGDAMERVDGIRRAFTQPVQVGESPVFVTASIGVALAPRHRSVTAEDLLRRADIATHRAKADGRNRVVLFDDSMQAHLTRRMDVEHALHGAIGRQEMRLYHQPIVDIVTGRVSGFEALIRWQRADGTLVSPGDFIAIAEETGIICEIGAWALNEALSRLRGWIDDGVISATTTMSVNVSPRQIADPSFAAIVADAIERSGVSAHLLWLEMTESMMLDEPELAKATLREIRAMGVRLALDDFGTGFSSLSLLQQFPIQRIKIDRAFVRGIAERSNDRSLVRTIIAMAQSMGLDMVAEGVETVHQLQSLRELGCDKAQGFLISHPVPPDAMRSTMAALDELASLSLFGPAEPDFAAVSTLSGLRGRPDVPVRRDRSGPLLRDVRRPLGRSNS